MKDKFAIYALIVTLVTTVASWSRMVEASTSTGGSSWSSGGRGGYHGGWSGGGGHK